MKNSNSKVRNFHSLERNTIVTTNSRLNTLCENFQRRKRTWIFVCSVVTSLILVGIGVLTVIILQTKNTSGTLSTKIVHTVTTTTTTTTTPKININTKWSLTGKTVAGWTGCGREFDQLLGPEGIYIDDDEKIIYTADIWNHRILAVKFSEHMGRVVAGGNGLGSDLDQLDYPSRVVVDKKNNAFIICGERSGRIIRWSRLPGTRQGTIIFNSSCCGLAIDNNGDLYVNDCKNNEVRRWTKGYKDGTIVAGGHGQGNQLNQLHSPSYLFVDNDYSVYVSDNYNSRVMKWVKGAKEGVLVAGGQVEDSNSHLTVRWPTGVIVDYSGNVYVSEFGNHRVTRWSANTKEGTIILGGSGAGNLSSQLNCPQGLAFDGKGNLYVVDGRNCRVQRFDITEN